jgi:predicted amidohydrolase YtcJ
MSCKQDQKRQLLILLLFTLEDIITMQGDLPEYAEALVIKDGKIEFVGICCCYGSCREGHQMINLEGKTLLPGFI